MRKLLKLAATVPVAVAVLALLPAAIGAQEFEGPYVVAEGGIGLLESDGHTLAGPFSSSDTTGVFGGALGYRTTLAGGSGIVLGGEASLGLYTKGTDVRYGAYGIGGYPVGSNGLLYGRLGYSWLDDVQTGAGSGIDGLTLGAGYEMALNDAFSIRFDYKFIDFGGVNVPDNQIDFDGHEFALGFVLKF